MAEKSLDPVELFSVRQFPIWNISIQANEVFLISKFIADQLIQRGVCITMEERKKRLAEKAKKKAEQEAANSKAESPLPKKTKKPKETEVSA